MIAGSLEIQLLANVARLQKDMADAKASVTGVVNDINRVLGRIGVGVSFAGLTAMAAAAIRASEEAQAAQRKLDAVIRATGNTSGYTADQLSRLADQLARASTFDDEGFRVATATLLRFGNIGGENLRKVLKLSADYAALTGTDVVQASEQLGKALNNPAEGLKRLERNFGDLGKETEAAIKLQQDMGNQSGALAIAIEALEKKIGGADQAMNAGLTGSVKQLRKALSELMETIGGVADNSVVTGFLDGVAASLRGLKEVIEGPWALKLAALLAVMQGRGLQELTAIGNMGAAGVKPNGSGGGSFSLADQDERALKGLDEILKRRAEMLKKASEDEQRARYEAARAALDAEEMFARDYAEAWKWADHYRNEEAKKATAERIEMAEAEERAREMALDDFIGAWKAYDEYVRKLDRQRAIELEQQTREFTRAGEIMASGFTQMFSDLLDGRLRDWKDFAKQLANTFKSVVVDFVGSAIRGLMNNLMTQLASGSFSLGNLMGGLNPLALAFAGGSIGGNFITSALGSGPRGQQIGSMAGGAGATLGFALGGPIGAVAGAVIGGLIGHFSDPDGLAQRSATFGSTTGAQGLTGYTYTSPFGTFGLSDTSWFSDQDMGEQLRRYFGGMAAWERSISGFLSEEETARVTAALSGPGARYGFGEEHGDFSATLGQMTADRANTILGAVDPYLQSLIEGFQGTGEELGQFVITLLSMRKALADMNITGLNMETLGLMAQAGETLEQTFQRVAGTWAWFAQNFYTEAEQLEMAQTQVNGVFASLGIAVPASVTDFRKLVEGLDLSTESGRAMWNTLMAVAPAFLQVTNAADQATDSTDDLSEALVRQAEIQRQIEESVRESRERQLANVVNARGGLQDFLNRTVLNSALTPLTPQERLAEAQRQYQEILTAAQGGDLGAAARLGGAAETYLQIAREMFASGSGYIDIFNRVRGDVSSVDSRLAVDEAILRATLGMAANMEVQVELLMDVKSLLLDIRDKPTVPAAAAAYTPR